MQITILLSVLTVLSWSLTWFAIACQLGHVPGEVSVVYRFAIASIILLMWCWWKGKNLRFTVRDHLFIGLQALFMFCLNYFLIYQATAYITSGINAVIFALILPFNIINSRIFFKTPIQQKTMVATSFGLMGLAFVFWPELSSFDLTSHSIIGLSFSLSGVMMASLGNIVAVRNQERHIPTMEINALGMTYGTILSLILALSMSRPFIFEASLKYVSSLLFLAIVGSIIGFGSYLTLVKRVGPTKAAYPLISVPIVALLISQFLEGFQWTLYSLIGVTLILLGNVLILKSQERSSITSEKLKEETA